MRSLTRVLAIAAIAGGMLAMPAYADAMSSHERWQVVLFVRSLQHGTAAR